MELPPPSLCVGGPTPYFRLEFFNNHKRTCKWTPSTMMGGGQLHLLNSGNGGLFQQVLWTWNENLCERSKKIEVEDRIQKTDEEDEETVLDFLAQYEVYGSLKKWWLVW